MVGSNVTWGNASCKARASLRPWVGPLKKSGSPKEMWVAPSFTCWRMSCITVSAGTMRNVPWYTGTTGQCRHRCLQPRLDLSAQYGVHAQPAQQCLVHGGVEPIDAEVRLRGEPPDARQGLHRDAGSGMHPHIDGHQVGVPQDFGIELLQRKIEAAHRKALALEPCGRLRQGKRLPPQLIGVDEYDLEGARYFDFGRGSKGAGPGSRLAPACSRRLRYSRHRFSRFWPSQ